MYLLNIALRDSFGQLSQKRVHGFPLNFAHYSAMGMSVCSKNYSDCHSTDFDIIE